MKKAFIVIFILCLSLGSLYAQNTQSLRETDWANYKKYTKENADLKQKVGVVFMGNSITEGWKNLNPEFFEDNPSYICRGISGQVTAQMLARFRADVINLKPQAVVILVGTNDIAMNQGYVEIDHIFENIVSMTELAKYNKIKVVLCSVLPAAKHGWRKELSPEESVSKIAELNARIKEYADANKIPYADYYLVMKDENKALKKEYQRDDVHPNKEGYLAMDKVIKEVLKKNFKL